MSFTVLLLAVTVWCGSQKDHVSLHPVQQIEVAGVKQTCGRDWERLR